jgi:hypothetical protein
MKIRKPTPAGAVLAAVMLGVSLALVPAAFAGKGGSHGGGGGGNHGGGGTSTLTLVMVNDLNSNGSPNWGDTVTFDVSTTATDQPYVDLTCSQNGVVVYGASTGFFSSYPWPWTQDMTLSSQMWTGGAAACTARLYYVNGSKTVTLAKLSFTADA